MIPKNQEAKKTRHDSKTQSSKKRAQTKYKQKNKSTKNTCNRHSYNHEVERRNVRNTDGRWAESLGNTGGEQNDVTKKRGA